MSSPAGERCAPSPFPEVLAKALRVLEILEVLWSLGMLPTEDGHSSDCSVTVPRAVSKATQKFTPG